MDFMLITSECNKMNVIYCDIVVIPKIFPKILLTHYLKRLNA